MPVKVNVPVPDFVNDDAVVLSTILEFMVKALEESLVRTSSPPDVAAVKVPLLVPVPIVRLLAPDPTRIPFTASV